MRLADSRRIKRRSPKLESRIHLRHMVTSLPWLLCCSHRRPIRVIIIPKQRGITSSFPSAEQMPFSIGTQRHRDWQFCSPSSQMREWLLRVTCLAGRRRQSGTLIIFSTGEAPPSKPGVRGSTLYHTASRLKCESQVGCYGILAILTTRLSTQR